MMMRRTNYDGVCKCIKRKLRIRREKLESSSISIGDVISFIAKILKTMYLFSRRFYDTVAVRFLNF